MRPRVDWIIAATWLALATAALLVAYIVGGAIVWLVQRALLVAWPFVQANADRIETALLVLAVVGLAAWTVRRQ